RNIESLMRKNKSQERNITSQKLLLCKATTKNSTFRINKRLFFETFAWLTSSMLLSLERANAWALLFARLIATLRFFAEIFLFLLGSHSQL
ncbi:MAG: hypothetical protein IKY22_08595, partial [Bacteroidales bacterium]|nr:hypothetical protein [Bacteroidales bacterium]